MSHTNTHRITMISYDTLADWIHVEMFRADAHMHAADNAMNVY